MHPRRGDPRSLIRSVHNRQHAKLRRQIRWGARINDVRKLYTMESALHEAAAYDNLVAMRILLRAGASVYVLDHSGRTPLHLARSAEAVHMLVDAGADLEHYDAQRCSPLSFCIAYAKDEAAAALIACGARVNPPAHQRLYVVAPVAALVQSRQTYSSATFRALLEAGADFRCRERCFPSLILGFDVADDAALLFTTGGAWCQAHEASLMSTLASSDARTMARVASYVPLNERQPGKPSSVETLLWPRRVFWMRFALIFIAAGADLSVSHSQGGTVRDVILRGQGTVAMSAEVDGFVTDFNRAVTAPTTAEARRIALAVLPEDMRPDRPQRIA